MKRLLYIAFAFMAFSCKPAPYLGPLDSPVGNWDGYKGEYFFDGEMVAELDSCEFKGISFYKQGYCCIEGVKGAFPYIYNESNGDLQIDSTLWSVPTLTGEGMVMKFVDRIYPPEPEPVPEPENPEEGAGESPEGSEGSEGGETPENGEVTDPEVPEDPVTPEEPVVPEVKPDKNGVILPAEYKGFTIEANKNGYFYMNAAGEKVYCEFKGWKNEADSLIIDFWFDSSTNYFVPMVVEITK
ncbi:MAG: hypothetical protein IKU36_11490 [Bacteroidales bacterium]|nr:hypothetical protein [Bacteroidales bacterium]